MKEVYQERGRAFTGLLLILALKTVWAIAVIQYSGIGLGPDEAQYWTWAKALDWGYYSKPPGIAWQIAASTSLVGDNPLGVRLSALILNHLLTLSVFALGRAAGLGWRASLWAAALMALSPLGILGSFLATTDGGFVFFWVLALCEVVRAIQRQSIPVYWRMGLWIALGALFKWPIFMLWIWVFLAWGFFPQFRSWGILRGVALSLLGLLPSVYWNASHDWATFRHVWNTVQGASSGQPPPPNPLDFFGAQLLLLGPVSFFVWLWSFGKAKGSLAQWPQSIRFLGAVSLLTFSFYLGLSFLQKMQGNWCVFVYPLACVVVAWSACEWQKRWLRELAWGLGLSVFGLTLAAMTPAAQSSGKLPIAFTPLHHNLGWDRLGDRLKQLGYDPSQHFLAAEKYQEVSELSFYAPGQKRAHFLNLHGSRKNQFCYWSDPLEDQGFFVLTGMEPKFSTSLLPQMGHYHRVLSKYFGEVEFLGTFAIHNSGEDPLKQACVFRCQNYLGEDADYGIVY